MAALEDRFIQLITFKLGGTVQILALAHNGSVWRYDSIPQSATHGWNRIDCDEKRFVDGKVVGA
jgi:hypothetical protein